MMISSSLIKFNETFTTENTISDTLNPSTIYIMKNFVSDSIFMLASVKSFDVVPELSIGTVRKNSILKILFLNYDVSGMYCINDKIIIIKPL